MKAPLLFIPAYRCAPQIPRVIKQLTPELLQWFSEVVVVDNHSPDDTIQAAMAAIAQRPAHPTKLRVVRNPYNMGLGGSHKMAFDYTLQEGLAGCVILHGDDQGRLHDFAPYLSELALTGQFLFGARFHPDSRLENYSPVRILGNQVFNQLASALLGQKVWDLGGSGLNYFPASLLRGHRYWDYADDLTFHVFLLCNALRQKENHRFVPISWSEEDQVSNVRLGRQGLKLLSILRRLMQSSAPLTDPSARFTRAPGPWQPVG